MKLEILAATAILTIAAYIDWKEHRVPNWLTYSAWMLGILFHTMVSGWDGFTGSLLGTVAGLATLMLPYALNGMGAGDVKLMASVGAWVGAGVTLDAFLWIIVFGALMGMWSIVRSRQFKERMVTTVYAGKNLLTLQSMDSGRTENAPEKILLPYGVPIAFGFYAYFVFGGLL